MTYQLFKRINDMTRCNTPRGVIKYHIDSCVAANDKVCSVSSERKKINSCAIETVVAHVLRGIIYVSNPSALSNWNFSSGMKRYKLLYHGTPVGIKGRIIPKSEDVCDFGCAFYTAELVDYSNSVALNADTDSGHCYTFLADLQKLKIYDFADDLEFWALFTAANRKEFDVSDYPKLKKRIDALRPYDILCGLIADDRSAYAFARFVSGAMTDACLMECLTHFKLGNQYAYKTQKACDQLYAINHKIFSKEEHKKIDHDRRVRIGTAQQVVDELEKQYRRKGRYFSEILEEYK